MPKETILLVDDSEDIIQGMKLFLELKEYTILTALNVEEMHSNFPLGKPSLVILDVFVSGADGREICRIVRNDPATQSIKIILTSAAPEALLDFKMFGADDILEKPFGLEELYHKVESLLKMSHPL